MMIYDESEMAKLDEAYIYTDRLAHFKRINDMHLSAVEIEGLMNHVKKQNIGKRLEVPEKWHDFNVYLTLLQDIIDSIAPVMDIDRCSAILKLFDVLKTNCTVHRHTPYKYYDIADLNLLSELDKVGNQELIIGVDASFIKALEQCSEWCLHTIIYDNKFPIKYTPKLNEAVRHISALGLFKRIISSRHKRTIRFYFKDEQHSRGMTYDKLQSLCHVTMTVDVGAISTQELEALPCLLTYYIQGKLRQVPTPPNMGIQILHKKEVKGIMDKEREAQFFKDFFDQLLQIEQQNQSGYHPILTFQEKLDHTQFVTYALHDRMKHYESFIRHPNGMNTMIDIIRHAWMNKALLLTV